MPRIARRKSATGVYHIIIRGINKQTIFEDDEDRERFLKTLGKYKSICNFKIYGYCLMNNHVHLLMKEGDESISKSMQRISSSYVYWYNLKYQRSGHLFQGRFKSEPVNRPSVFLRVLRYIHQNPLKAGITRSVEESKWTSYRGYMVDSHLIDRGPALYYLVNELPQKQTRQNQLFQNQQAINKESYNHNGILQFQEFMKESNEDAYLEWKDIKKLTDDNLLQKIHELGIHNINKIQGYNIKERNELLRQLKAIEGVSIRQLSRITGISKSVISRA